jgi:alpha-L-fucosidase 2
MSCFTMHPQALLIIGMLAVSAMTSGSCDAADSPLVLWQDAPPNPAMVSQKGKGLTLNKGNTKIQWDVWGLPIGNGRLGGVFYGSVAHELIQFNEDSLWTGREGWASESKKGAAKPVKQNFGSYQPFGDIELSFPHATFTHYRRELDIARGVGSVTYASGGVTYRREYFASYPDQVLVVRLTADKPGSYTGTVRLTDRHFAKLSARAGIVTARGRLDENLYVSKGTRDVAMGTPEQVARAQSHIAGNNLNYEAQMQVLVEGGSLTEGAEGELRVERADSVLILLAAGTDYLEDSTRGWRGPEPHAALAAQLQAAAKRPYAELLARHLADYQSLFNRFHLDLGRSSPTKTALPMDKRLADYRSDSRDPELEALLAQYGRYLMISSSRPGSLPANLQGLWNPDRVMAAWGSDYHININLQMNYWLTEIANLPECAIPLFDWMTAILPVCERETKARFGTRGWTAPWALNPFGGAGYGNGKVETAWLCQHLTEHYAFGGDKAWLKDVALPLVHKAVLFWEDHLIEKNGLLVAPNTKSPEIGPYEDGVSYAQEIVWELFTAYVEMADVLGTDKVHRDKINAMRANLATPKVGSWGQLMEWMVEHPKEENSQHRHVSHLYALYPGRQIAPATTPELAKAAEVILRKRGDEATGWSKAWKSCFWARLLDGDHAMQLYRNLIKENIWPNLFDSINGGDKFQIDANFGATAAVCEMLLQSQVGELHLLPALPSAWPTGFVQGIRGRGGFTADLTWTDGKLTQAVFHSTLGKPCKIRYGQQVMELAIGKGQSVELNGELKKQ